MEPKASTSCFFSSSHRLLGYFGYAPLGPKSAVKRTSARRPSHLTALLHESRSNSVDAAHEHLGVGSSDLCQIPSARTLTPRRRACNTQHCFFHPSLAFGVSYGEKAAGSTPKKRSNPAAVLCTYVNRGDRSMYIRIPPSHSATGFSCRRRPDYVGRVKKITLSAGLTSTSELWLANALSLSLIGENWSRVR